MLLQVHSGTVEPAEARVEEEEEEGVQSQAQEMEILRETAQKQLEEERPPAASKVALLKVIR